MNEIEVNANVLLDTLIWSTCRYCIGRRSYVSLYARSIWRIIKTHRTNFNEERLMFLARDIRSCISQQIMFIEGISVTGYSNYSIVYDAYTLLCKFLMEHSDVDYNKGTFNINCFTGVVEYKDNGEIYRRRELYIPNYELLEWVKLANAIDKQIIVSLKDPKDNVKRDILCVEVIEGRVRANGKIDWRFIYCPVNYHWSTTISRESIYKINGKKHKKK